MQAENCLPKAIIDNREQTMGSNSSTNNPTYRVACGGTTQDLEKHPSALYHGERIAFCTLACLKAFESDPDRFMAGEIEHPAEDDLPSEYQSNRK